MRILGRDVTFRAPGRRPPVVTKAAGNAQSLSVGGWFRIFDHWPGAWQQDATPLSRETILAYHAVYACVTLIAADIGKLRHKLVEQDDDGIWTEVQNPAFSPVLRRPNGFQNHIQFKQWWTTSKLLNGNAYALKLRDARGIVITEYVLDPCKVEPLVTPSGEVYYRLRPDNMTGLEEEIIVPAREIIHDRMNCLFHPLVGTSPIYACGAAATVGINIQKNSSGFFANSSVPGGILTAPGAIAQATADRVKAYWEENYTGDNSGKVAVLGDGLKFEPMRMSSVDAQLIEQLKWTAEVVCSCFHVPPFKIGIGTMPTYQNGEMLNQIYYSDCLQSLIEEYEACQDEGLGLDTSTNGRMLGVELDLDGLFRMDRATQVKTLAEAVKGSIMKVDEARAKLDMKPTPGGDTIYMQQQNFSLAALAERDSDKPFAKPTPAPTAAPAPTPDDEAETDAEKSARLATVVAFRSTLDRHAQAWLDRNAA